MRRILVLGIALAGLLGLGAMTAPPASANVKCDGVIDSEEPVVGPIVVPKGAECIIQGTTIFGGVTVRPRAALFVGGVGDREAEIQGGLFAEKAHVQLLPGTRVAGSAEIFRPIRVSGVQIVGAVCSSRIGGDLLVHRAPSDGSRRFFIGGPDCGGNRVGANVRVLNNKVRVQIGGNVIGANLECTNNDPPPVPAGDNDTSGVETGQCASASGF